MEPLNETEWDLILSGTGLPQSLLALALSRSGKKILQTDKNDYYGGAEAALSLQDAEDWVRRIAEQGSSEFRNASIIRAKTTEESQGGAKLGFARSYSLALCPQIIYARSTLLSTLVSSKTYRQLDFLAVGSWWIFEPTESSNDDHAGSLKKIPAGREDVFADKSIDIKSKRSLIKFVKLVADPEALDEAVREHGHMSFGDYLFAHFGLPSRLQSALHALTLLFDPPSKTKTAQALPRINRHLTSFGVFGPGFNAVIPKWGGIAEVTQVACRALAVGGGIYMLGRNITKVESDVTGAETTLQATLDDGDVLRAKQLAGRKFDLPIPLTSDERVDLIARSVYVVSSKLDSLLPPIGENGPSPAGLVVVFPTTSLGDTEAPVYLFLHTSDTGECPNGQSIIYASAHSQDGEAFSVLDRAVETLLQITKSEDETEAKILWRLQYHQQIPVKPEEKEEVSVDTDTGAIILPDSSVDLAFDDSVLTRVREVWQALSDESGGFMQFEDREVGAYDDDDE